MTPERWQEIRELVYGAMQVPVAQRSAFLDSKCSNDPALRQEVCSFLAAEGEVSQEFLERPIARNISLTPGSHLGPYEIVDFIGAGGMGQVFKARDTSLGRDVAIKILLSFVSVSQDQLRRFEQEARAAAALNHPNILSVFQLASHQGIPYLVSELLQGTTLREQLARGPLPTRKAIDYGIQIARGLAAAHEKGIIHRDLKPENLYVTKDGRAKILDFGLAKLKPSMQGEDNAQTLSSGTEPGVVLGTVGYMSPEQVRGETADHRADIFAFGAILYEMLAGRRAFQKPTPAETMSAILNEEPPAASQIATSLPAALQRVVHRCLEKSREQRFQSASDLAFALEALSEAGSSPTVPTERTARKRKWISGVAAVAVVASVLALQYYVRRRSTAPESARSAASLEVRTLTESGKATRSAATPDGRYIAYVHSETGNFELRLLQVSTERDVVVLPASPKGIYSLHFSPDGNFIYYLQQLDSTITDAYGVFRIATLGGPSTPVATDARMYSVTVSPDGKRVAYITRTANESQIVAVDPDGGSRHILAKRPLASGFWFVEWSPSQNSLAAVAIGKEDMGLVRVDLPAGAIQDLSVSRWEALGQPAWSPDGTTIYSPAWPTGGATMQIWAFDARTGAHRAITSGSTSYLEWSLSSTAVGDLIANTLAWDDTLWVIDHSGRTQRINSLKNEGSENAIWVDDRVVTSNTSEIIVHEPNAGRSTKLRSYSEIYRQLSRCGPSHVVYWASDDKHQSHIARTDITSGATAQLTDGPLDDEPSCTADGSTLVFVRCMDQGNRCVLAKKSLGTGQLSQLYDLESDPAHPGLASPNPTISPDGTTVLFRKQSDADDLSEWAMTLPIGGGEASKLKMPVPIGEVGTFRWAADGKSILYARSEHGVGNIWSVPLNGKTPRKLTAFDSDHIFDFDVSADGRLVISRGEVLRDAVLLKNPR
jgi:serine/threonine protein kinase